MFEGIGRIGAYVNLCQTRYKAHYRIRTGKSFSETYGLRDCLLPTYKEAKKRTDDYRLNSIKQRLVQGKELSAEELRFLKEHAPQLYKKALVVEEVRRNLRIELSRAKTKDEARQAMIHALSRVNTAQATDVSNLGSGAGANLNTGDTPSTQMSDSSVFGTSNMSAPASISTENNTNSFKVNGSVRVENPVFSQQQSLDMSFSNSSISKVHANSESLNIKHMVDNLKDNKFAFDENLKIMCLRALQDEWQKFVESEEYEELPANISEENVLKVPRYIKKRQNVYAVYKDIMMNIMLENHTSESSKKKATSLVKK